MISAILFFAAQLSSLALAFTTLPIWIFFGYQIIYFMYHPNRWWYYSVPSLRYSLLFSLAVITTAFIWRARGRGLRILDSKPIVFLLLLLAWFFAVQIWSYSSVTHSFAAEHFVKTCVIAVAAFIICDSKKSIDVVLIGYVAGAAYLGYYTYQFGRTGYGRVEGIGTVDAPDVNDVAAMLAPAAVFALHFFWRYRSVYGRVGAVVCGAFIVNALVLMNSRGAYLGLLVGAAYYMWRLFYSRLSVENLRGKVILVGILGFLAMIYVVDDSAISRFVSLKDEAQTEPPSSESGSTRIYFWLAAIEMSKDHPMGLGAGGFVLNSHQYIREDVDTGRSRNRAVHSTWFQALTEVGYPGFILFLLMLLSAALSLEKARRLLQQENDVESYLTVIGIQAACGAFLVSITFLDRMRSEALYWLVMLAAAAAQVYYFKSSKSASSSARTT